MSHSQQDASFDKPPPYSPYYSEPASYQTQPPPASFPQYQSVPGFAAPVMSQPGHQGMPTYGSTIVVQHQPEVIFIGGCPACRIGTLEEDFTCMGVLCAILCFPLGLICCLALRQKRCTHCGITFD